MQIKRLANIITSAQAILKQRSNELGTIKEDVGSLLRLMRAYKDGHYRNITGTTVAAMVAALVYFINPFDVIPDFIIGAGLLDDITVLTLLIKKVHNELSDFVIWEKRQDTPNQ